MIDRKMKTNIIYITYTILLAFLLFNISKVLSIVAGVIDILSPLWIGLVLAFILNVPMSNIEKLIVGDNATNKKVRAFSLTLSTIIILLILVIMFVWIIPDFVSSITFLLGKIPSMVGDINTFLLGLFQNTELSEYLTKFNGNSEIASGISNAFKYLINNLTGILSNAANFVINFVTGIIIAFYLLFQKENVLSKAKFMVNTMFTKNASNNIKRMYNLSNKAFHDFITYQCLECFILGFLMFIAFTIFRFPYALTIASLTCLTAFIPYFGATIACVIGFILVSSISINQGIIFVIVFQVVQQIENNLIYPRVVGKKVGLPPIITILAIIIGGKLGGVVGMIACVPIASILYSLALEFMNNLESKKIKVHKLGN